MRLLTTSLVLAFSFTGLAAQNLTSENVLRVHFVTTPPFNTTPDAIRLNFGLTTVHAAYTNRRAVMWDCADQLGTYVSPLFGNHNGQLSLTPGASFKSPTSLWTFDNAGTATFTGIQNGTIQGIIDFTIDTGAMTIPLNQVNLTMIRATGSSGGSVVSPAPTVTNAAIVPKMNGPVPGTVNANNTWTVTGATPSSPVFFGIGTTCAPLPVLGTVYDIANPLAFIAAFSDPQGVAALQLFVPPQASGAQILVQAVEIAGPLLVASSFSSHTF